MGPGLASSSTARHRRASAGRLLLLLALGSVGCDAGGGRLARAVQSVEPHLETFVQFDEWARRTSETDAVLRARGALNETTFARIRRDDSVLAAWIDLRKPHPDSWSLPDACPLPDDLDWLVVQTRLVTELRVSVHRRCPVVLPRGWRTGVGGCVLIQRSLPSGPGEHLVVTVAFRDPAAVPAG